MIHPAVIEPDTPADPRRLSVRLLGPFTAELNHRTVTPTAAKQRQILALLALNAGRVVTVPTLAEELWGDRSPQRAASTLQTYVLHLRNRLVAAEQDAALADAGVGAGAGAGGDGQDRTRLRLIRTRQSGYMLDAHACRTDIEAFLQLARAGRTAAEAGEARAAADLLTRALALWRGPALADLPTGPVLELEAASLEGTRLGVLERRIEADLALGRHADIVGELTLLVARNPMNENFCRLLMMALYRAGHVGLALDAFRRLRDVLTAELGVEPCPRSRWLQQAILSGDPALETTVPGYRVGADHDAVTLTRGATVANKLT